MGKTLIVGISGSSGSILGIKLLEFLWSANYETHLITTSVAESIISHETSYEVADVKKLATKAHENTDFFAPVASGSFKTDGMVIIPCSMKTLAGIASGYSDNLLLRAADVSLKEKRKLVLVTRETPLSLIHIENMAKVTKAGAIVLPPVLSLYTKPEGIDDMLNYILGKVLDVLGIDNKLYERWGKSK
ncbi:MAG: UbiX family flavin prenyltransferase [Methanomassiliicoccales archaeon]|nr:MAG: UbiX family flavin prenyltransferase [Methanomassiliicoccales archaeon]